MKLIRYTQPNNAVCRPNRNGLESLFDGFDPFFAWPQPLHSNLHLSFDSREDKDNFYLQVEVPGFRREDLKLNVVDQVLTIQGRRKSWKDENAESTVERAINLPEQVDPEKISARVEDGILSITLPKREEVKPREIQIKLN
ncbi:MAG: Hsp20/alpha crystallin family protein [Blastochloris sp.]|nr:Hsp20/alpha crystallin family protein [Blastochloris sp.]